MKKYCLSLIIRTLILSVAAFFGVYLWISIAFMISWRRFLDSATVGDHIIELLSAVSILALLLIFAVLINTLFLKDTRRLSFKEKLITAIPISLVSDLTAVGVMFLLLIDGMAGKLALAGAIIAVDLIIMFFVLFNNEDDCKITEEEKRIARSRRNV